MAFLIFISFIILLRVIELIVAAKNERWMRQNGAIEFGADHYPFMVTMHSLFFVALLVEYKLRMPVSYIVGFAAFYILLVLFKAWVISTLGKYWNTKILRIPGVSLVSKGPYKFIKHPNYVIVVLEIAVIPLSFHLYYTAIIFSFLNALMLYVRIKAENKALNN